MNPNQQDRSSPFAPDSMINRIFREGVVLLGGGRAILLQLAHPLVAAGVDDHSNFQSEILSRLYRTVLFWHNMVFEGHTRLERTLRDFHAIHERIQGTLKEDAGRFPAGTPYSGKDPRAKLWVHATFIDTSLKIYEQFVTKLTPKEREMFYQDTRILGRLMSIPQDVLPESLEDFDSYMDDMLHGDTLEVTDTARRLANAVLHPDVGFFPSITAALLRPVTAEILPARFRGEYGLTFGLRQRLVSNSLRFSSKILRPFVPPVVWQNPLLKGKLIHFLLWGYKGSSTNM
jgi:uncharacterized protein (DUF2236 family)